MYTHRDAITKFVQYFQDQLGNIEKVSPLLFRKILYTALDPIARAAFGATNSHRKRVTRLIDELTAWKDRDRISLPQLALALEERQLTNGPLYAEVKSQLSQWQFGSVLSLNHSPLLSQMVRLASPTEASILSSARCAELFYTYRDNLIHEFRHPGYGVEKSSDGVEPYYHSMIDEPWQLVFPVGFFARIVAEGLRGLEARLLAEDIDPYSKFEFGSLWRSR